MPKKSLKPSFALPKRRILCGDVLGVLPTLGRFTCLIADPPDGIGLAYNMYDDTTTPNEYRNLFSLWVTLFIQHADIVWVSFNAKYVFMVGSLVETLAISHPEYTPRLFIPTFTFGQHCNTDCGNGYRPLLRLKHRDARLYPESIRIPSWRMLNGDKRASPSGRVPLDHWPEFPRITGNSKERRSWHPTQLREAMIDRIVKFSTVPGDSVCDVFSGTGTVLRAVSDRHVTSIELDITYCERIAQEHNISVEYATQDTA